MTRVYFIDDSETTLFIYRELINRMEDTGIEAFYYPDATKALVELEQHAGDPDVTLMVVYLDIQMPSLDGFDFLELLEEDYEDIYDKLKVYMLTSSVMKRDREMAERFKVVRGFLEKPLMRETLIDTLRRCRE